MAIEASAGTILERSEIRTDLRHIGRQHDDPGAHHVDSDDER
jgi:hypothetical protein